MAGEGPPLPVGRLQRLVEWAILCWSHIVRRLTGCRDFFVDVGGGLPATLACRVGILGQCQQHTIIIIIMIEIIVYWVTDGG
jgi:hypothetical protein